MNERMLDLSMKSCCHGAMPTTAKDAVVTVRLPSSVVAAIDNARREDEDMPSRPEILRRAIVRYLEGMGFLAPQEPA